MKTIPKEKTKDVNRLRATAALERGRHFYNSDRFAEALVAFEEAVAADPTFTRAYTAKAHALTMLGRAEEAVAVCLDVIASHPDYPLAYSTLGSAYNRLGRKAEAQAAYEKAVALGNDEPLVHYNFACFWALAGDAEKTREHLARSLALDPTQNTKAATDSDFAGFRDEPWFQELVAFKG